MQSLTTELLAAQQANGQKPYIKAVGYSESFFFTPQTNTTFYPPTGQAILFTDSCKVHAGTGLDYILTVFFCTDYTNMHFYYRWTPSIQNWGLMGSAPPLPVEATIPNISAITTSSIPMGISVTSDWTQNATSSTVMICVQYMASASVGGYTNPQFSVWYGIYTVSSLGVLTQTITGLQSHTTAVTQNVNPLDSSCGGISGVYDSTLGTGIIVCADYAYNNGLASNSSFGNGDWVLRYYTISNGAFGTTGNPYILPATFYSQVNNIQLLETNGVYYGAVCGFTSADQTQVIKTFSFSSGQYTELPFTITGPKTTLSYGSYEVYGPMTVGLGLADMPVQMSQYPNTSQVFCLTYGYVGQNASFTDMIFSLDFTHWGYKRTLDPVNARMAKLFDDGTNYGVLFDLSASLSATVRTVTTYDFSNDVLSLTAQDEPEGSPSTLDISIANSGYVGANITKPLIIQKNAIIIISLGYNTTSGNEAVQHGIYYIDTITQKTDVQTNDLQIQCRDAFKRLATTQYLYQINLISQYKYQFNGTIQDLSANWSKLF